jgi:hypothetical protein
VPITHIQFPSSPSPIPGFSRPSPRPPRLATPWIPTAPSRPPWRRRGRPRCPKLLQAFLPDLRRP